MNPQLSLGLEAAKAQAVAEFLRQVETDQDAREAAE